MGRLSKVCPGDCSECPLLQKGEVQMVPCILDQIFQRTQRNEELLNKLLNKDVDENNFASVDESSENEEE